MKILNYKLDVTGQWKALHSDPIEIDGKIIDNRDWRLCNITDVPLERLLNEYDCLLVELGIKEVNLFKLKEQIDLKSFEMEQTVDFKKLYGKNNADIRKMHIKGELVNEFKERDRLELSVNWIKHYIPLLKEVIRSKRG